MQGLAWVNGFNLGWYWPAAGPQMTTYVPGPLLRAGGNDVVLLEFLCAPADAAGARAPRNKGSMQCSGPCHGSRQRKTLLECLGCPCGRGWHAHAECSLYRFATWSVCYASL